MRLNCSQYLLRPIYHCGVDVAIDDEGDHSCWCIMRGNRVVYSGTWANVPWWFKAWLLILGKLRLVVVAFERP